MTVRLLLAGGGTAGHVNPLLALADAVRDSAVGANGAEILVLGTAEGLESRLVPERGYELATIPRVPFPRRPDPAAARFPRDFARAVAQAERAIDAVGADVVVGFGGYVATPAYRAAARRGVPVVIHEQNVRAGLANRLGARTAAAVALTFAETRLRARRGETTHVGLPMRADVSALARRPDAGRQAAHDAAAARLGLDPTRPVLLVTGGSLGAQRINLAMAGAATDLTAAGVQVLHAAGRGKVDSVAAAAAAAGEDYHLVEYLDDMASAYAAASLVLGRSGAGTVCEQAAVGLPGVYVPLPIGNGEQRLNVRALEEAGGAVVVEDAAMTPDAVRAIVLPLLLDAERRGRMAAAARAHGVADGAERLRDLVLRTRRVARG